MKIRNKGTEAIRLNKIRGQIIKGKKIHREHSDFQGAHYVECYVIKDRECVAMAHLEVPIGKEVYSD